MTAEPCGLVAVSASSPNSLDELARSVRACVLCPDLVAHRSQAVPGVHPSGAEVLFVGEAPGADEDRTGEPFVGKAGQLLDSLLVDAGLPRSRVAVSNVVKCRPPANRKPRRAEVERCRPWLHRQIELVHPLLIIALGATAAQWFAGPSARIEQLRKEGSTQDSGAPQLMYDGRRVIVTYHPSAAIRFGPNGAPLAALRGDLVAAVALLGQLRAEQAEQRKPQ